MLIYLQANAQSEASTKAIFWNVKKNIEVTKGKWLYELPKVLWAHRTTKQKPIGQPPSVDVWIRGDNPNRNRPANFKNGYS